MRIAVFLHAANAPLPAQTPELMRSLTRRSPRHEWVDCADRDAFLAALPACHAAAVWDFRPEWTALAKNLRLLATPAAGREWIRPGDDVGFAVMHGTFHGVLMAETVVGLMLAFARGIKASLDLKDRNPWPRAEVTSGMWTLRKSRVLILGFGHIGKGIGGLLKPFGACLTGVNRADMTRPDYFAESDETAPITRLDEILPRTDHLVMALPGGRATDNIIDARRLGLLPAGACVYNVGRGNSLDAGALAGELLSGRLGGAGLDVFNPEPLASDSPLRGCPNVILMPHVSAMGPDYLDLFFDEFVARLETM